MINWLHYHKPLLPFSFCFLFFLSWLPVVCMWCGTDVTRGGVFPPLRWGVLLLAFLTRGLAAALPRELPGPFSGADPDTHPSPKMRSWSKSMSRSERIVPRRGFIPRQVQSQRDLLCWTHRGPCHAISWVWFLPPRHQRLHLYPKPVLPADRAQSCHPLSQLFALTFGISPQDGYSRGSSRTSFSQAVLPCVLPAQRSPSGWSGLLSCLW